MIDFINEVRKRHLSQKAGLRRSLSLFTLSCIGRGYGQTLRKMVGIHYGVVCGIGNSREWRTLLNVDPLVIDLGQKLRGKYWMEYARTHIYQNYRTYVQQMDRATAVIDRDPASFLRFLANHYADYWACLGFYNAFWRYLEFRQSNMPRLSKQIIRRLAKDRDEIARIYPRCEALLIRAARRFTLGVSMTSGLIPMHTFRELRRLLHMKRLTNFQKIHERSQGYAYLCVQGKDHVTTDHAVLKRLNSMFDDETQSHELTGKSAFKGSVRGPVITASSIKKYIPKHAVFVTAMTHPDQLQYLKRCAAIVTDEGGVLSHAAIACRELRIPCVIGTKIATKVFRDGDRVEVDANHGVVRKL